MAQIFERPDKFPNLKKAVGGVLTFIKVNFKVDDPKQMFHKNLQQRVDAALADTDNKALEEAAGEKSAEKRARQSESQDAGAAAPPAKAAKGQQ
eukprot:15485305-Alexandrium_andersonii.AAC.1